MNEATDTMGKTGERAVFLSYASQDAAAVRRIAEALRAAGVEVWFDQNELVGGDAWDQKIRGQIASCALFVPVISAATQARREGYFRIEWKLAAQRTHAMADGTPFLLPVVIDGTRDAEALVPAEFRVVQWTRLPGGDAGSLEKFCARVGKLLNGDLPAVGSDVGALTDGARGRAALSRKPARAWWVPAIVGVAAAVALGVVIAQRSASPEKASPASTTPPASLSEAAQLAARAKEIYTRSNYSREDLTLAEDFARRATELESGSATAWGVRAGVQATYLYRGWDLGEKRMQATQGFAVRALGLNPDEPEALLAQGNLLRMRRAFPEAEAVLRRALAVDPANNRVSRTLQAVLKQENRVEEGRELLHTAIARDPGDPLLRYDLAMSYADYGGNGGADPANVEAALVQLEAIPSDRTVASALLLKAALLAGWRADLGRMRAALGEMEKRPLAERMEDRAVYIAMWGALLQREPARAIAAAVVTTQNYFDDVALPRRPKAWSLALAHLQANRQNLAQTEWRAAEAVLRQRLQLESDNAIYRVELATTLAWLGRLEEARKELAPVEAAWSEELIPGRAVLLAQCYAALGDATKTTNYLARGIDRSTFTTRKTVPLDPWWDKVKDAPEFRALYAEPGTVRAAATYPPPDAKSVAVLAFENRSDDKANEYFSDGIADELLTTLQKIPGLKVSAHTSAWSFKGKNATSQEIGEKLHVAHIVEGTVQKSGNRVKITARLSRAATNEEIWSKSFGPIELTDVFATQSELAQAIVAELRGRLGEAVASSEIEAQVQAATRGGTKNVEAHQLYLQGRFFVNQNSVESAARAIGLLQRAVEIDPQFALGWAELSHAGWMRGGYGETKADFEEGFRLARSAADKALALDSQLAAAHLAKADVLEAYEFKWNEAHDALRRALALMPDDANALMHAGGFARIYGRRAEARELMRRAVELDPVNAQFRIQYAFALNSVARFEEAEAEFRRVIAMSPNAAWGHAGVSLMLSAQGRFNEAAAEAGKETTSWSRLFALTIAQWGQKKTAESDATLKQLIDSYGETAAVQVAWAYGFRGDGDHAFEWLERSYRQHDAGLGWTKSASWFDSLHHDPRWEIFLRQAGLADDQLK